MKIAIDGPASAGKSTISKKVAQALHYTYLDTGAMYRAATYLALKLGLDLNDASKISEHLAQAKIDFQPGPDNTQQVLLNGVDITATIRSEQITGAVSQVAALPEVRQTLVAQQRKIAAAKDIVMDGRDIGTTVLPDADVKIFMTASVAQRAQRRYLENTQKGMTSSLAEIKKDIELRDYKDSHRQVSPLKQASDAVLVDTSNLDIEQVTQKILAIIRQKMK
ncbi:cytidylate kinase [Agrilactobacillus composti DSM 18527 = JCM 14202]|uniref:Cytidylate kinase n=1 Tax=Agrilactobacillus composti DSM 18527 = JCM 14202 TaxID=1423734 RepID=X0QKJ7_9LACO|nr:(d)CMP kinase [Agrilactobacillus composti]KRM36555.1 cytidylate kinase [Agrilactobacillus composti DSM 18527 = JCM 14202]GAF39130.1 cytidylate kinase [Agrilactobacillus composti DSM 18527 = JCM 14202]